MYLANKYYITIIGSTVFMHNVYRLLHYHYRLTHIDRCIIPFTQLTTLLCCYIYNFNETNVVLHNIFSNRLVYIPFAIFIDL